MLRRKQPPVEEITLGEALWPVVRYLAIKLFLMWLIRYALARAAEQELAKRQ